MSETTTIEEYKVKRSRLSKDDLRRLVFLSNYLSGLANMLKVESGDGGEERVRLTRSELKAMLAPAADAAESLYCDVLNSDHEAKGESIRETNRLWKCCPACGEASTQFDIDTFSDLHEEICQSAAKAADAKRRKSN